MHPQVVTTQPPSCHNNAVDELFARHYGASFNTAIRILRSREDAEDAVQTAYCRAFEHLNQFRGDASFKTWITSIVVNCCLMKLRQGPYHPPVEFEIIERTAASQGATPEILCYWAELAAAHAKAVSKLPNTLRDVYAATVLSGEDFSEVALRLRLKRSAAKSRLFRARRRIQHALAQVVERKAA